MREASPIARAVLRHAASHGLALLLEEDRARPWASATFVGGWHELRLAAARSGDLESWAATLVDADLVVRGGCVAELTVTLAERRPGQAMIEVRALVIDD